MLRAPDHGNPAFHVGSGIPQQTDWRPFVGSSGAWGRLATGGLTNPRRAHEPAVSTRRNRSIAVR